MPNFLADHMLHLCRIVVLISRISKIVVVVLYCSLCDMYAAGNPNLCHAQPARVAIGSIADFNTSAGRTTILRSCTPSNNSCIHYVGFTPVRGSSSEH